MEFESDGHLITAAKTADGEATQLETTATIPTDTSIDVTVFQDESGGTAEDNSQQIAIGDGTNTYSLNQFNHSENSAYWLRIDLATAETDVSPEFDGATVT